MMTIDNVFPLYALLISNAVLLGAASIAIVRLQSMTRDSAAFWNSPTGSALKADDHDQDEISCLLEERCTSLQEIVEDFVRKESDPVVLMPENSSLKNAMRMAQDGASLEDLTRSCGLSKSEARLLMCVHTRSPQVATSTGMVS